MMTSVLDHSAFVVSHQHPTPSLLLERFNFCNHTICSDNVIFQNYSYGVVVVASATKKGSCVLINSELFAQAWGYWHQRADERHANPISGQRQS